MATEYELYLSADVGMEQVLKGLLARFPDLSWSQDRSFLVGAVMRVGAFRPHKSRQDAIEEGYGFAPGLLVWFRRDPEEPGRFSELLLEYVLLLLGYTQDAVLLFNGELTVMQRLGGQVAFDMKMIPGGDEAWLRSHFPLPFECRPLPSPLVEG